MGSRQVQPEKNFVIPLMDPDGGNGNPKWRFSIEEDLTFINLSHPDDNRRRVVQQRIRSHVMTKAGDRRRKKPRRVVIPLEVVDEEEAASRGLRRVVEPRRVLQASSVFAPSLLPSSFQLPAVGSNKRERELIGFMMAEADRDYRPFRATWFHFALSDTTAFSLSLATAALYWNNAERLSRAFESDSESIKYYFKSVKELSRRLDSETDCLSGGVIATTVGLICYDTYIGNWSRYTMHMDGLEMISTLRLGFDGLGSNLSLMAFWLDLVGAAVLNSRPRFPVPGSMLQFRANDSDLSYSLQILLLRLEETYSDLLSLFDGLRLLGSLVATVNRRGDIIGFWRDEVEIVTMLGTVSHHLLSMPSLLEVSNRRSDDGPVIVQEMVRLAGLMILSKLKRLASHNYSDMPRLQQRFLALLDLPCLRISWELQQLRAWAFVIGVSLAEAETKDAIAANLHDLLPDMGFPNFEAMVGETKQLMWLNLVPDIGAGGFRLYRPNSRATGDSERYCDGNIAASFDGNPALQIKET
ncbi:hypothetical protein FPSE_08008 [Fusarium pseudograminearum CS3096]|uniref:Transcription factor domain-containing protein n=1 Tax=Fusarium pseudograminearum (strain CS3096) TaxID=1028729 RepID=K3VG66_FUSPC|nr:hypothetical protein FPSE_08008 [Fusarium pseudograminearum CS3096]EKJ71823.1 hypothetical protein FPSE_08008 [Fusarium pseudograminearum CS3096]